MTQLTSGQVARIQAMKQSWGGSVGSGLVRLYGDSLNALMTPQEAAAWVDLELAYRTVWLRKARQTPEGEDVKICQDELNAVMREM